MIDQIDPSQKHQISPALQDLKPENLLLDVHGFCKAGWTRALRSPFGCSEVVADSLGHIEWLTKPETCGWAIREVK